MNGRIFHHHHRVTYAECTAGNHIYYARYLDLLEAARGGLFRHVGQPLLRWQENDTIFPVIECRVRYKGAARYDDELTIEVWLDGIERVRLTLGHRVLNQAGRVIVEASTLHACTTLHDKLKRLPEELAEALRPYLRASAVGGTADAAGG